jgi:hypothetical protein
MTDVLRDISAATGRHINSWADDSDPGSGCLLRAKNERWLRDEKKTFIRKKNNWKTKPLPRLLNAVRTSNAVGMPKLQEFWSRQMMMSVCQMAQKRLLLFLYASGYVICIHIYLHFFYIACIYLQPPLVFL